MSASPPLATVIDPVCGMQVDPAASRAQREWQGRVFHFCCAGCAGKFDQDPAGYADGTPRLPPVRAYVVLEPTTLGGQALEPGEWVAPLLAAANRDPAEHPDPDRFDVDRRPNHHLAFSAGAHHCLGATLARVETEIALRELFGRFGSITRRPPAPQWSTFPFRRLDRLPVRVAR